MIKKVYQDKWNNCTGACLASLTGDLSFLTLPFEPRNRIWIGTLRRNLRKKELQIIIVEHSDNIPGYTIAGGPTERTKIHGFEHSCIYKEGKLIHDPFKNGGGLTEIKSHIIIVDYVKYGVYNREDSSLTVEFINKFE